MASILNMRASVISLVGLILGIQLAAPQLRAADAFEQNRRLGRGVNIIGYDPIWRSREQGRFKERHFHAIKEAGFSSVRVNLHPFRHMDRENGWKLRPAWLETLDWVLENAERENLMVILDFHEFRYVVCQSKIFQIFSPCCTLKPRLGG